VGRQRSGTRTGLSWAVVVAVLVLHRKEKVHRRSLNLSSNYKINLKPQNQIQNIPQLTKSFTLGPSVVLTPILSDVVAESAWNPRGPTCHGVPSAPLSFTLLPLPLISLSLSHFSPLCRMPRGWGGRRGEVGEDIRRAGDATAAAATMREKGERHRLTARATSGSGRRRGPGGGGKDAKAHDSGWRWRCTTRRGRRFGTD
jgi:hypothetical protein